MLPEVQKREIADKVAFCWAVINILKLKPGYRNLDDTFNFVTDTLHDYFITSGLANPNNLVELNEFQDRVLRIAEKFGCNLPYHRHFQKRWIDLIENTPFYDITQVVSESLEKFDSYFSAYYGFPMEYADTQYLLTILKRRLAERRAKEPVGKELTKLHSLEEATRVLHEQLESVGGERAEVVDAPDTTDPIIVLGLDAKEVALLFFYSSKRIIRGSHANDVARNYGFFSKTSGEALCQAYDFIAKQSNRTNVDGRARTWMIKHIERVLPLLREGKRQLALIELKKLRQDKS